MLIDRYGRVATDLRVSLTDKCNLRCSYCMPAEGLAGCPPRGAHRRRGGAPGPRGRRAVGVAEVRFTGGEPLLRRGLVGIVAARARLRPPEALAHDQRVGPAWLAAALAEAGLDRVNVSLDTLDPQRFETIARRRRLDDVLAGLPPRRPPADPGEDQRRAHARCQRRRGAATAAWALGAGYELRFIEQMPLDAQHAWGRDQMVTGGRDPHPLRYEFELTPDDPDERGSAPAETWLVDGRPRQGRRHRLGDPAVLRRLRPHPAHRRRAGPQLPVRPTETDLRPCAAVPATPSWRGCGGGDGGSCPGTASTTRASCSRCARCRRSADRPWSEDDAGGHGEAARRRHHDAHRRGNTERARGYCTETVVGEGSTVVGEGSIMRYPACSACRVVEALSHRDRPPARALRTPAVGPRSPPRRRCTAAPPRR